ncbi:MAG: hypothetical protein KC502_18505 [Myxococcales bacterium]|nr:hypothetical protein [Myxococcales bacterium]
MMSRSEFRRLSADIDDLVHELAKPALRAAALAVDSADGGRALDLVLVLYGGKGLYRHLTPAQLRSARRKLLPLAGQAISVASGVDLKALARGEGGVTAVSERVSSVRQRIERHVPVHGRRPLLDLLGNVARPMLKRGWQLVDQHLKAARTEAAVLLGQRLAAVFPKERALRQQYRRTLHRAAEHHRGRARAMRAYPGITWGHLALAARYGGSTSAPVQLRQRLREVRFRMGGYQGCQALQQRVRSAIERGTRGVTVTSGVQLGRCQTVDRAWKTKKRVSWTEWRTRRVRVRESYTAYVNERKCRYVRVYANTTCTSRYVGNGYSRRTCRANYNNMQRCRNVSRPVTRQRWVMRTQRYQVRLSLIRTIYWYETQLRVSGRAQVRWPGGSRVVSLSYSAGLRDHGFRDRAGSRTVKRISVAAMANQAAARFGGQVHALHSQALRPQAAAFRQQATAAAAAGQELRATDFALRSWLLGGRGARGDVRRFAKVLRIPLSVASQPHRWTSRPQPRRRRVAKARRNLLSLSMDQAFGGVGQQAPSELVNPALPPTSRSVRRLYRELRTTAWAPDRPRHMPAVVGLSLSNSPLRASRLRLVSLARLQVSDAVRLYGGVELAQLGWGTYGWQIGADVGAGRHGWSGLGLRYATHQVTASGATGTIRSSNLDVSYFFRVGRRIGFWGRLSLNVAAWLGDEALAHFHPQSLGLDVRFGPVALRGGVTWYGGGGGVRWLASTELRF